MVAPVEHVKAGQLSSGEGDRVADMVVLDDGSVVVCGILTPGALPAGTTVFHHLLAEGEAGDGGRAFVAKLHPGLAGPVWLAMLPPGTMTPTRIAADADGGVVVGGRAGPRLGELAPEHDWGRTGAVVVSLSGDGGAVRWIHPGGPNQDGVTGLAMDGEGRTYVTGGTRGRGMAAYVNRVAADGTGWAPFADLDDHWALVLHHNDEQLNQPGEFWNFYKKGDGEGFDYDGEGRGWGPVRFWLHGIREGGQVLLLPDGDLVVSGTMQYDFRVEGDRRFPAFDLLLARYSPEGRLRWSTNLYQEGDSVHTPDQKAVDLAYDGETDSVLVLARQHGSNVYRFKGDLRGDTGNLMIHWLGRVDAGTGDLEAGWYFQNNRHGRFEANGLPQSPPHPRLSGNRLERVRVGHDGRYYLTGSGAAVTWTTGDAWQAWPEGQGGGGQGVLLVLRNDLATVDFATCLFTDTGEAAHFSALAPLPWGVVLGGSGLVGGGLMEPPAETLWSGEEGSGALLMAVPVP